MQCVKLNDVEDGVPIYALLAVELYGELARSDAMNHPFYAVLMDQEAPMGTGSERDKFVNATGSDKIMQVYTDFFIEQKKGEKVILLGFSTGGTVALEVAKNLVNSDVKVEAVILLDAYLESSFVRSKKKVVKDIFAFMTELGVLNAAKFVAGRVYSKLKRDFSKRVKYGKPKPVEGYMVSGFYRISKVKYSGNVFLLMSSMDYGFGMVATDDYGLREFVDGQLDSVKLPVNHENFLKTKGVEYMAPKIKQYLQALPIN